jgi:phenylpropionate dioxygenase-like ring-hydroxylating dioxygenase large terminal subunit
MFIHQHQLQHLLRPDQYFSPEQHRLELQRLFHDSWHPIATTNDLARPGDFLTLTLLDTPVLVRNFEGELRAFLNVCPHRHSRITDQPKGNCDRLRCQYHGWEFNKEGRTGQIPDARAFRPWDRENSCLRTFRLERCGEILFLCLSDSAPPLQDWAGPLWERWAPEFGGAYEYSSAWAVDFPCNWKVVLENSLESYHIPLVHPKTFKDYPEETNSWHELDPNFSTFRTVIPNDWVNRRQAGLVRSMGMAPTMEYWHHVRHPHVTFSSLDVHRMIFGVFPTSPTTCRYWTALFTLRGHRRGPVGWVLSRFLRPIVKAVAKRVFEEDGSIYQSVQKGLEASPHRGVIGTREERIFAFQQFVQKECERGSNGDRTALETLDLAR